MDGGSEISTRPATDACVGIVYDERMLLHEIYKPETNTSAKSAHVEGGHGEGEGAGEGTGEGDVNSEDEQEVSSVDSEFPHGHPECPQRISSIFEALNAANLMSRCQQIEAEMISYERIESVHDSTYVKHMQEADGKDPELLQDDLDATKCTFGTEFHDHDPDEWNGGSVYMNQHTVSAARVAAGGVVRLVREVCDPYSRVKNGFAIVRPPGHHAEPGCCMGFSIFNNVAIAAQTARREYGCERVLIVDWDIHHGNGTQHMFLEDENVLYFSVHRFDNGDFYPCGTEGCVESLGERRGEGYNINVPWNLGIEYVYDQEINYVEGNVETMKKSKSVDPSSLFLDDQAASLAAADPLFGPKKTDESSHVQSADSAPGVVGDTEGTTAQSATAPHEGLQSPSTNSEVDAAASAPSLEVEDSTIHPFPASANPDDAGVGVDDEDSSTDGVDHFDTVGDSDYDYVWEKVLLPVARQFSPDLILISAGFDAARGDPLGGADVTPGGYQNLLRKLIPLAKRERVVLVLEGGYNLEAISNSAVACVEELVAHLNHDEEETCHHPPARKRTYTKDPEEAGLADSEGSRWEMEVRPVRDHTKKTVKSVIETHKRYWHCLQEEPDAPAADTGRASHYGSTAHEITGVEPQLNIDSEFFGSLSEPPGSRVSSLDSQPVVSPRSPAWADGRSSPSATAATSEKVANGGLADIPLPTNQDGGLDISLDSFNTGLEGLEPQRGRVASIGDLPADLPEGDFNDDMGDAELNMNLDEGFSLGDISPSDPSLSQPSGLSAANNNDHNTSNVAAAAPSALS